MQAKMISTTNERYKLHEGKERNLEIMRSAYFGNLRTSRIEKVEAVHTDELSTFTINTMNSVYVFEVKIYNARR